MKLSTGVVEIRERRVKEVDVLFEGIIAYTL
jgi:hypothetical protein